MAAVVTVTEAQAPDGQRHKIQWTWLSHTDGSASLVTPHQFHGEVLALVTDPGATAPTDNYDITITDADGYDVLQGAGANRDTANTETAVPPAKSIAFGALTLNITNAGDSKVGVVTLYIQGTRSPA